MHASTAATGAGDVPAPPPASTPLSRRTVVAAAGAAAMGVTLAATGCTTGAGDRPSSSGAPGSGAPEPETETGSDDATRARSGSGGSAAGTVLGTTADIPVGGGAVYPGAGVVVIQPTRGTFTAFSATCTHESCTINKIADGTIDCPCHGSRYHLDGTVAAGPAPRPLDRAAITVRGDQIVLG